MDEGKISKDIVKRIDEYKRNLDRWTHYEMLYITKEATDRDIKNSYRKLVQLMHPDRYGFDLDPDHKATLETIFNEINIAYNVLLDKSERSKYDASLYVVSDKNQAIKPDSETQVAKSQYIRGINALKKNEITPAIEFFRSAIKLRPGVAEYYAKLAYALSKQTNPRLRREAIEPCREAIKIAHENPNYHALMGYLFIQVNDDISAEKHFRRALSWDPQHHKAREELKSIAFRAKTAKKEGSLLTKLTGFLKPKTKKSARKTADKRPPGESTHKPR